MIPRSIHWLVGSLVWIGGIYASVSVRYLDFSDGHTVCGPWGCGGTIEDLTAMHAAWAVVMMPPVFFVIRRKKQFGRWNARIANIALFSAILVFLGVVLHTLLVWIPSTPEHLRGYYWQRIGFVIVNMVDVPLTQLAIAGIAIRFANRCPRSVRHVLETRSPRRARDEKIFATNIYDGMPILWDANARVRSPIQDASPGRSVVFCKDATTQPSTLHPHSFPRNPSICLTASLGSTPAKTLSASCMA